MRQRKTKGRREKGRRKCLRIFLVSSKFVTKSSFPRTLYQLTLIVVLVSYQILSLIVTFSYISICILVYLPYTDLTNSLILTPFVLSTHLKCLLSHHSIPFLSLSPFPLYLFFPSHKSLFYLCITHTQ